MVPEILTHTAMQCPGHIAVIDGENTYTYYDLYAKKQRLVSYLINDLHVKSAEVVAISLPNCIEFIYSFFALTEIGAVSLPLNIHLKEKEIRYFIDTFDIAAVITESSVSAQWGNIPLAEGKIKFILIDMFEVFQENRENTLPEASGLDFPQNFYGRDSLYLSTSGSTGAPKIISRTLENLLAGADNVAKALAITDQDRFLSVIPFFHANGFSNSMFLPVLKGATIILMREFFPRKLLQLVIENNITVFLGSPFIFSTLSEIVSEPICLGSVRHCLSSGAPLPGTWRNVFLHKFGLDVRQLYGSSETGTVSIQLTDVPGDGRAVGRPLANVQVKIMGEEGKELPPREIGEILVKSRAMTKGYLNEPLLNEQVFSDGYFRTGDLGTFDEDGILYLTGRTKILINVAGVKVDPVEVENILLSFHKIRDAYVFGVKNRRGGETVKAELVPSADCTVGEVISYCKDRLADYKIPRLIEFKESISRNILGKVVY